MGTIEIKACGDSVRLKPKGNAESVKQETTTLQGVVVHFEHRNRVGILKTEVPSIAEVEGGFWVDCGYEFCKTSEAKYWIPPSVIKDVEKV